MSLAKWVPFHFSPGTTEVYLEKNLVRPPGLEPGTTEV